MVARPAPATPARAGRGGSQHRRAIAFVASLGAFVTQSHAALTVRAAASVPVDWQVQVTPQGDVNSGLENRQALPDVSAVETGVLRPRAVAELDRRTGRRVPPAPATWCPSQRRYAATFPGELRHLLGATSGTMLFQQTAANLAAEPGARITVHTVSGTKPLTIDGIVDMPAEDSFFQVVGLAQGAGVSAPPDNVVLVPPAVFRSVVGNTTVVHQLHVGFSHAALPSDPQTAAIADPGSGQPLPGSRRRRSAGR